MRKHNTGVSEGDKPNLFATRTILGKKCRFYRSGEHTVDAEEVTAEESYESILLRYTHASLLIQQPVGDKAVLWVDARTDPCEVWIHNMRAREFLEVAKLALKTGAIPQGLVVDDNPIPVVKELINERNVGLH
jgi:hypothetical protein